MRNGPPGFSAQKRPDPSPPAQPEAVPGPSDLDHNQESSPEPVQVPQEKPKPSELEPADNRGWSRVIDSAPRISSKRTSPRESVQKGDPTRKDPRGSVPPRVVPTRKSESRKPPKSNNHATSAQNGASSWINRRSQVGTKINSSTKLNSKSQWRALRQDAKGEWDLTLFLPDIPVPSGWKALTHPLLKDHGELHKKLMSECGCKISIEGLKNEEKEIINLGKHYTHLPAPGIINLHSDVGEKENIVTAATRLLDMFNEILAAYNLPKTTILSLSSPRTKSTQSQKPPPSKPTPAVSKPPQIKQNYIKTLQKPREVPKPRETQKNAYFVKATNLPEEKDSTEKQCRWCYGLQDCGDETNCWFRPYDIQHVIQQ